MPPGPRDAAAQWTLGSVAFGTSLAVFLSQLRWPNSDLAVHILLARKLCSGGGLQPHFLFELLTCGLAAPLNRSWALDASALAIVTAAVVAKVVLTFRRLREVGGIAVAFFAALGLLFAMPLCNWWNFRGVYLGQVSPNVWHNPTSIAVLPFAFLLFRAASRWTIPARPRAVAGAGALALLNALIKPNYLLALLPCWLALAADRWRRETGPRKFGWRELGLVTALLVGPTLGILAWQASHLGSGGSAVVIAPLAVWRLYSPHIPVSILLGIAFPLAVLVGHFRVARRQESLALGWLVLFVGVLQMAWLAERGPRFTHGNLFWASYTANYLLFVESAAVLATAPRSRRSWATWGLLSAHALVGLFYVAQLIAGQQL